MSLFTRRLLLTAACLMLASAALAAPRHLPKITVPKSGEKFTFVAYGDTRSHAEDHAKVIAAIVRLHPEFVLQSGDLVSDGRNPKQWAEFEKITQPLRDAHIGYYPARGNHDVGPYYLQYVPKPITSGTGYYYAFTRHGSRFIALDSMDPDEFSPEGAQYLWLVGELTKARKTAANIFVMFHEGPYSVGPHGPTPDALRYLRPLFVKYGVRAVFCGHDHLYYRTVRDGVTYFVTGGGGAPLYPPSNAATVAIPGDVYASVHHIIRCDVDGSRVTFTTIALDRDPEFTTPWHQDNPHPFVTVVTPGGPRNTPLPATPGGAVIDRITAGPK